jgi:hypothetical protein
MKRLLAAHVAVATLVLFAATGAQASPIPASQVEWSYNFTPGAASIYADSDPSAAVTFTNEPTKSAVGNSDVVATNLRVVSTANPNSADVLSANGAYSITLVLGTSANGSPMSGSLTFTGKLSGTFSSASANVANVFGPNTLQTPTLGSYIFTVQLTSYTPPGPPNQLNAGSISAHVSITYSNPGGGHISGSNSPEPSTMLLSGLGLTFLSGAAWRKRRQGRTALPI